MQFSLRVARKRPTKIAHIPIVHADDPVKTFVILRSDLPGPLALTGDSRLPQLLPGAGMDGIPDLFRAGGGGFHRRFRFQPAPGDHIPQDIFRHGAAANIAMADEQYLKHQDLL